MTVPDLINQIDNPFDITPDHEICGMYREYFQGARSAGYGVAEASRLAVRETQDEVWQRAENEVSVNRYALGI